MISRFIQIACLAFAVSFLFSCKDDTPGKSHGPIILGDSSTIVTEKDPLKLQDMVTDLQPEIPSKTETKDTPVVQVKPPAADTGKKSKPITPVSALPSGNGLAADFSEVSVFIQNVNAKQAGKPNLLKANGAVYTLTNGNINNNIIKVTGNVTKVSQRYQSVVVLKNNLGTLPIESLSTTTAWKALNGGNNMYRVTGLEAQSLDYPDVNTNTIRTAVAKAAQRRHMSKKKIQEMLNSVHNVKEANQKPLFVMLRSVMWKIDGKDAKGKIYSKQIRVDIPF